MNRTKTALFAACRRAAALLRRSAAAPQRLPSVPKSLKFPGPGSKTSATEGAGHPPSDRALFRRRFANASIINTNIAPQTARRNLGLSQSSLNPSIQRLSSGLRINSAKDDAAGLAISERFTSQIRGLDQA